MQDLSLSTTLTQLVTSDTVGTITATQGTTTRTATLTLTSSRKETPLQTGAGPLLSRCSESSDHFFSTHLYAYSTAPFPFA